MDCFWFHHSLPLISIIPFFSFIPNLNTQTSTPKNNPLKLCKPLTPPLTIYRGSSRNKLNCGSPLSQWRTRLLEPFTSSGGCGLSHGRCPASQRNSSIEMQHEIHLHPWWMQNWDYWSEFIYIYIYVCVYQWYNPWMGNAYLIIYLFTYVY